MPLPAPVPVPGAGGKAPGRSLWRSGRGVGWGREGAGRESRVGEGAREGGRWGEAWGGMQRGKGQAQGGSHSWPAVHRRCPHAWLLLHLSVLKGHMKGGSERSRRGSGPVPRREQYSFRCYQIQHSTLPAK